MDDDFSEFCSRIGTDIPVYRECQTCGDLIIVDPANYDKPKKECDPEGIDECRYWLPVCECQDGRILYTWETLEECTYPDCKCNPDNE